MASYKLIFHKQVEKDLNSLDKSILIFFEKKLKQVLENPNIGIELGNKLGFDLTGFKKVYFANKKYRIVYKILESEVMVYVISVGKRESFKVYKDAYLRLK